MRSKQRIRSWWLSRRRLLSLRKRRRNLSLTTGREGAVPVAEDGERELADEESTLHGPFPRGVGIAEKRGARPSVSLARPASSCMCAGGAAPTYSSRGRIAGAFSR